MRKWNKLLALVLAMVMVFGLTATAFADDEDAKDETPTETTEPANDETAAPAEGEDADAPAEGEDADAPAEGEDADAPAEGEDADAPAEGEDADAPADDETAASADEIDYTGVEDWALEEVKHVVGELKLIAVRETGLEPAATMTRAEFVAALYNLAGAPAVEGENAFTDVADTASYKDAVIWAVANEVVTGNGDGTFNPDGLLNREQIAVFLYRYAKNVAENVDVTVEGDQLAGFADLDKVDEWAVEGLNWAVANKVVNGSDGNLDPQGPAQRQMAAALLSRYITNILDAAEPVEPAEPTEGEDAKEPAEGEDAKEPAEGEENTEPAEDEKADDAEPAETDKNMDEIADEISEEQKDADQADKAE